MESCLENTNGLGRRQSEPIRWNGAGTQDPKGDASARMNTSSWNNQNENARMMEQPKRERGIAAAQQRESITKKRSPIDRRRKKKKDHHGLW
jgi:hypothetical protein